ncbi:MAG: helix-turn-helix transcriptional regulator [Clostridia bacterium]|nr:helix-turn-helix transcriptional regulator [Clostridia bacterium]
MNDLNLYERIMPQEQYLVRVLNYKDKTYGFSPHWHEHIELHFLLDGACTLKCGDEEVALGAGDCGIINGNELHCGGGGVCSFICLILSPAFFEHHRTVFQKKVHDPYVGELIGKIAREERAVGNVTSLESRGYAYLLIAHLINRYAVRTLSESVYSKHFNKMNLVNRAVSYMNEHYVRPISTAQLADMVHLSEGYFCQIFKEVMGKTAIEYLGGVRAEKAEQLLKSTDMTVAEIAFCCGFGDANYFSRVYKRVKGKTPRQTREG